MDVIAKLPDCEGQAADAVSAYTHVNLEDAPRLPEIPMSECPDGRSLCPVWKTQLFFLSGICMVICYQDCCVNGNWKKYYLNLDEKGAELGLSFCSQATRIILKKYVERYCDMAKKKDEQLQKVSSPCLDGHQFKKEELESVENYHKWFHKLSGNACTWYELDDLISHGLSINWFVQLPNGLKNVTED